MSMMLSLLLATVLSVPSAKGSLIICNQQDHNVYIANLSDGKVVHKIKTGFGPHEAAVSPSGKLVAISNYGTAPNAEGPGNSLTIIELPGGKVVKTVSTGEYLRPHGLVWRNENEVFATSEVKQALILVDIKAEKVAKVYETKAKGSHMLAWHENRLYSADIGDSRVTQFDVEKGEKIGEAKVGAGSEGIGISPDGKYVWTGNRGEHSVSIVETATMKTIETIPTEGLPYRVCFTPDGSKVLVPCPMAGELAVFDAKSRKLIKRVSMNGGSVKFENGTGKPGPVGVTVHPNGKYAYCAVQMAYGVAIIDLEKLEVVGKIDAGKSPDGVAVSLIDP
jgi:YVTN family beta-propeller protein